MYVVENVVSRHSTVFYSFVVEEIAAPVFVNACGPWSGKIVDLFASRCARPHSISPLPVKPRKRSVFMFHRKPCAPLIQIHRSLLRRTTPNRCPRESVRWSSTPLVCGSVLRAAMGTSSVVCLRSAQTLLLPIQRMVTISTAMGRTS